LTAWNDRQFIKTKIKTMNNYEKQEIIKNAAKVFVYFGGLITLAFAIYYITDLVKKWY